MRIRLTIYFAVLALSLFAGWWFYASLSLNLPRYRFEWQRWQIAHFGDRLDREARSLAGWRALDCGHIRLRGDANPGIDCALSAFRIHRPFRVRFDLQGLTSPSEGVVFTPTGDLVELYYDRLSSDSLVTGYYIHEHLYSRRCDAPVRLVVARESAGAWVECSPEPDQSQLRNGR